MLEVFRFYSDLEKEVDILQFQIENMEKERENWWIGGKLFSKVPMSNAAERADKLAGQIEACQNILEAKQETLTQMRSQLALLNNDEYRVAYKRFIEKKTLDVIAEEMNYSINTIKKISSRVKRHLQSTEIAHF
jgi:DNA-directed RNA polymerase specialized sigma24 family protein